MANAFLKPGLHEALLTRRLEELLTRISDGTLVPDVAELRDAEASDRISRHVAGIVARAIDRVPEGQRSGEAVRIAAALIRRLQPLTDGKHDLGGDEPLDPARVLAAGTSPRTSRRSSRGGRRRFRPRTSRCSAPSNSSSTPSRRRCSSTSSSPAPRATIATCSLRPPAWVGGQRPSRFEHVFASIQSLHRADVRHIDPTHFDVVIVDEFHHAAAPSYEVLLEHLRPVELLGLTATPERADGLDVLRHFDGRIAAERNRARRLRARIRFVRSCLRGS